MKSLWLPLKDIPAQGREFSFSDPDIWEGPRREFGLEYQVEEALKAELRIQLQPEGCLIRGKLTGVLQMPCDRCTEKTRVVLRHSFDEYEGLEDAQEDEASSQETAQFLGGTHGGPKKPQADEDADEALQGGRLRAVGAWWELDVAGFLWEQLVLALPVKPLCKPDCKGLCPICGTDLNKGSCSCRQEEGDPRLAVLRGLKLS